MRSTSPTKKGATQVIVNEADDQCQSLFYDNHILPDGRGIPNCHTISAHDVQVLKAIRPDYRRLPMELYKNVVECMPIVCVDIICQRKSDHKMLLFYRRDKPAAHIFWWPGGRMFRGETFFDAAIRKIREETGNKDAIVNPVGVVNVWNTFFPDSSWDEHRSEERRGTQTVNIVVSCMLDDSQGDSWTLNPIANETWAVEAHRWVTAKETLEPDMFDKYVRLNVQHALRLGYLCV